MSETSTQKVSSIRFIAVTAMLSAIAFILMYIEIAVPIMPSFVKFDFSDLPAIIGAFALGPICGVLIELIKNLLHLAFSQSLFIGELSNFILGAVFCFVAGFIYKKKKTKQGALVAGVIGAVTMGVVSIVSNLALVYPIYIQVYFGGNVDVCIGMYNAISSGLLHLGEMKSLAQCILCFNVPFTIAKGLLSVIITMFIYKPLRPILKGNVQ